MNRQAIIFLVFTLSALSLSTNAKTINSNNVETINDFLLNRSYYPPSRYATNTDSSTEWSSSWVDTAEVRIQHEEDERELDSNTYRFRIKPKYGTERDAEQSFVNSSTRQRNLLVDETASLEMLEKYEAIINIISLKFKITHLQDKLELLKVEINAEQALKNAVEFKAEKLQGFVLDYDNTKSRLMLLSKRLEKKLSDILGPNKNDNAFFSNLIQPQQIQSIIKHYHTQFTDIDGIPSVQVAKLDQDIADSRLKLYQSQRDFGIELLEVKYEDKRNSSVGFMVGFRLPTSNDAKSIDRRLDVLEADSEYHRISHRTQRNITSILDESTWYYETWKNGESAINKINALLQQPSRSNSAVLVTGLRNQLLVLNKENDVAHIKLLKNYIELLHLSGLLIQTPLKNWLSNNTHLALN